jgi:predicted Zn-dependent peptidase
MSTRIAVPLLVVVSACATVAPRGGGASPATPATPAVTAGVSGPGPQVAPVALVGPTEMPARTPPPEPLTEAPWVEPAAQTRTLASGLKVVVIEHRAHPLVSVRLVLRSGAAAESPDRSGVTWLALAALEDRFERRNAEGELLVSDEKSVRREVAEQGNAVSFGVIPEASWLSFDGYAADTRRGLQTLRDLIKGRRHGSDGFVGRRDGQLDAIDEQQLTDDSTLYQQVAQLAFGAGHPYAQRVGGTPSSLNLLGEEDVLTRQNELLQPRGATLLIVGDVDAKATLDQASSVFAAWANTQSAPHPAVSAVVPTLRTFVRVIPRTPARTTQVCATRALGDLTASDAAVEVFAEVLGMQLNATLREDKGFTYGVESVVVKHERARALLVCARLAATDTTEAVKVLFATLEQAKTVEQASVDRARASLQTRQALQRRDARGLVGSWVEAVVLGRPAALADQQQALARVTRDEVAAVAKKALVSAQLQLLFSGDPAVIEAAVKANNLGKTAKLSLQQLSR